MNIRFSKSQHGPVLVCTRDDGSVTGAKPRHGAFFVRHDLMHYAVETTLCLRRAFFGLIAEGRSLESFNMPGAARGLPADAVHAEFIVGLLDQAVVFGQEIDAERVNRDLRAALAQGGAPPAPDLTQVQLQQIVKSFMELYARYQAMEVGKHLELQFASPAQRDNHRAETATEKSGTV